MGVTFSPRTVLSGKSNYNPFIAPPSPSISFCFSLHQTCADRSRHLTAPHHTLITTWQKICLKQHHHNHRQSDCHHCTFSFNHTLVRTVAPPHCASPLVLYRPDIGAANFSCECRPGYMPLADSSTVCQPIPSPTSVPTTLAPTTTPTMQPTLHPCESASRGGCDLLTTYCAHR